MSGRLASRPILILVGVTVGCLAPFAGKAFHIDEPLFLWAARHIQSHPWDFYGFNVNWYGAAMPMSEVTKNPPLTSYYIALAASVAGWSEIALRLAFLIPASASVLGTYFLARQCGSHPLLATLAGALTPVFLVSSTSVMSDIPMLALWVWTVVLWVRGLERNEVITLVASALLLALCALTKYYGMTLIPLLLVYSLIKRRGAGWWVLCLLIPVLILAGYQWVTHALYGRGLLLDAASYATRVRYLSGATLFSQGFTGLTFIGGGLATILFYAPLAWSRRVLAAGACLAALVTFTLPFLETIGRFPLLDGNGIRWIPVIQLAVLAIAGIHLLALAGADLWIRRDGVSLLLFLWILGTFIFASFLNWTVNARSILPMVPAAGILLMRRIEQRGFPFKPERFRHTLWPLIPGACLALLVTWADYGLANSARSATAEIHAEYGDKPGTVWFQGHWGFQYYMESGGSQAIDGNHTRLVPGDVMVIPINNTNLFRVPPAAIRVSKVIHRSPSRWVATMNVPLGAGFYADVWGPLPFAVGPVPPDQYYVFSIRAPLRLENFKYTPEGQSVTIYVD